MGYFLQKSGRAYVIIEKKSNAGIDYSYSVIGCIVQSNDEGSFFLRYPRHRRLISINKRHTGKDIMLCL